jgi:signal peptidase I
MTFALILLVCTLVTGLVTGLDACYLKNKRLEHRLQPKWVEYSRSFFPVFLLVFVFRSFLIEPFRIPSGSLEPTLLVGDFIAVNKFSYGLRFPIWDEKFLPLGNPKTGDIAVFSWPPAPKFDYIKRVIGVPQDKIGYHNKVLSINGVIAPQKLLKYTTYISETGENIKVAEKEETLNGLTHKIYIRPDVVPFDFDIVVPKGHYFMMGDNRDSSSDSRYWGFVPDKNLRGKAFLVWMSWNNWLKTVRWSRIGMVIH